MSKFYFFRKYDSSAKHDIRLKKDSEAKAIARSNMDMDVSLKEIYLDKDAHRKSAKRQTMDEDSKEKYLIKDLNPKRL